MIERVMLFEVHAGDHHYKIFTNGEVEGFGDDVWIVNHYAFLELQTLINERERLKGAAA